MARINLGGQIRFVNKGELKKGESVVADAIYGGFKFGEGNFSDTKTHLFQPKDGGIKIGISSKVIDTIIEDNGIKMGDRIDEIVYKGQGQAKKGKNAPHLFDFFIDDLGEDAPRIEAPQEAEAIPVLESEEDDLDEMAIDPDSLE